MATKTVDIAAKQRKQKIYLAVGGVLLAALLAIQLPKLMHRGSSSASSSTTPTATTPATTEDGSGTTTTPVTTPSTTPSTGTVTPPTGTVVPPVTSSPGPSATVAGIVLRPATTPTVATGQLKTFTLFSASDPFVPQVASGETSGNAGAAGGGTTATPGNGTAAGGGAPTATPGAGGSVVTPSTQTPVAFAYATLMVNGKAQQLQLKQVFPKGQPTFVLTSVAKGSVKVGVAGGKFTGGKAIQLDRGKKITLMNTATGQRFVMKLVYTGSQPEQIAGFNQPATGTTQPTTQGTTQTTTQAQSQATTGTSGASGSGY